MTDTERAALWAETRKRKEAEGWVVFKLRSTDPNWSPENPGDFFKGDWGWCLKPNPQHTATQPVRVEKKRLAISTIEASVTF